jgi:nucleoside-diphosphate-sugar epimerase
MNKPPPRTHAIRTVNELEALLSEPSPEVIETMARLTGDILLLGAGGKMGPTLARMARRASQAAGVRRRVIAVSRFSNGALPTNLAAHEIETISCDLLDAPAVEKLPDAAHVIYLAGMKFGATGNESLTWAMNSFLPGVVCRKFRQSRIVAFSTGNVYGLTRIHSGGSREGDPLNPIGEYAMSCVGRERVFEYFGCAHQIPLAIIRLNYASELRYGVLVDLARRVQVGEPVDVTMGHFNTIWQGDASAMALRCLDHVAQPPFVINITGPETLSVRTVCERFGELLNKSVHFTGVESTTALLSDAQRAQELFGQPRINLEQMITWTAQWIAGGGSTLGKLTHFEARDGKF